MEENERSGGVAGSKEGRRGEEGGGKEKKGEKREGGWHRNCPSQQRSCWEGGGDRSCERRRVGCEREGGGPENSACAVHIGDI